MLSSERAQSVGLRERSRQDKLARILAAGRELFSRDGFDATTTRDIARRAGIGTGTLFLYFPEKRDLLLLLFKQDIEPVHRAAVAALEPDLSLLDALLRVFRRLFDYYARDLRLSRVFLAELALLDPARRVDLDAFTLEFLRALADLVARAQSRGEARRDVGTLRAAHALFSLYYATLLDWVGGRLPSADAAEAQLRASLALLLRGLADEAKHEGDAT
ncbi:MAG: helix-turn-helix domain-containing protein [Thermodesulfobacteriota bacterium]